MAGFLGFGQSSASITMIVDSTPGGNDLALTNFAFVSASDLKRFSAPGSASALALVGDSVVLTLSAHQGIRDGDIGLNAIHRRHTKVSKGDQISVSRFVPPDNFSLALLTLELEFVKKSSRNEQLDAIVLAQQIRKRFNDQVMSVGQRVTFEFCGTNYIFTVNQATVEGADKTKGLERGIITSDTYIVFEAPPNSGIKIINQREAASSNIFREKEFNLQKLGIGGLSEEFTDIFRRAFASRVFPPHVVNKLGIKHVKGMLLYGPPGTGKTLMARQIGKLLNGREPKIVNGPEVLSKFVGETEKNVRDLFADAENDQRARGDESDLHVIIFDEIDAICKSRGSTRDGTGVHDSIVNQLLTKIDGVESLNNVLLIGMTNRKDLLDEALLRPGRLEVHVEINLPDEHGRLQILQIHTNKMKESSFLAADVNLQELAARTKNYSGAELEGVVKSAVSFALNRQISMDDLTKPLDEESIKVTMDDFLHALQEIVPAFGASTDDLERCRLNGMVDCGERHRHIYQRAMLLVEQVKVSKGSPLVTCLLEGPGGSGKSALAATVGIDSDFAYVKIISAETMIGLSESTKCAKIVKVFEDAYRSQLSIIILDNIERLLEYVAIGPRFSNLISQTLLVLLKRLPPKGKNLLVIGTTSEVGFLESLGICDAFSVTYHVPTLDKQDAIKVLQSLNVFSEDDIDSAAEAVHNMPLKKMYMLVEMAAQGVAGGRSDAKIAPLSWREAKKQRRKMIRIAKRMMSNIPENAVYGGPKSQSPTQRVTLTHLRRKHQHGEPITMVTAYDYPSAVHVDAAGIDVCLVGDSAAMVVHGHDTTLPISLDEMLVHCRAVARGASRPLLVGDLPFGSYESSSSQAVDTAVRVLKEGGMDAIKLEGGAPSRITAAKAIVEAGIAVMGHVGLTPQAISVLGGFRPQGKTVTSAVKVVETAMALQDAGCFSVVLECVPAPVAAAATSALRIPTIGIGAGPFCSGQVLVYHDLLGMMQHPHHAKVTPKFCKQFGHVGDVINKALSDYKHEVESRSFPGANHMPYIINAADVNGFMAELQKMGLSEAASAAGSAAEKFETDARASVDNAAE